MSYAKDSIYYREFPTKVNLNAVGAASKWRIEFIPYNSELTVPNNYIEFPDFVFFADNFTIDGGFNDGIPVGNAKSQEMQLTINLSNLKGDWVAVRDWILDESITVNNITYFNQWIVYITTGTGAKKLIGRFCQIANCGFPKFNVENKSASYTIIAQDIFRAIAGSYKTEDMINDIISLSPTIETLPELYDVFCTPTENRQRLNLNADLIGMTISTLLAYIISLINWRAETALNSTGVFTFYYNYDFVTFYTQFQDGSTLKNEEISFGDCYTFLYFVSHYKKNDGLFYSNDGINSYNTIWDFFDNFAKSFCCKFIAAPTSTIDQLSYDLAFFNATRKIDFTFAYPEIDMAILSGFTLTSEIIQRDKIFGDSTAHFKNVGDVDTKELRLTNDNLTMFSDGMEQELLFNNYPHFIHYDEENDNGNNINYYDAIPANGLFYKAWVFDKYVFLAIHNYCKFNCDDYTINPIDETAYGITSYEDIGNESDLNSFIYERQNNSGIGAVWAKTLNRMFAGAKQVSAKVEKRLIDIEDIIEIGDKCIFDINSFLGLDSFTFFSSEAFITERKIDIFNNKITYELLIRG